MKNCTKTRHFFSSSAKFLALTALLLATEASYAGWYAVCPVTTTSTNTTCSYFPTSSQGTWAMGTTSQTSISVQCCPSTDYDSSGNTCNNNAGYAPQSFTVSFAAWVAENSIKPTASSTVFKVTNGQTSNNTTSVTNVVCNPTVSATATLPANVSVCVGTSCETYNETKYYTNSN